MLFDSLAKSYMCSSFKMVLSCFFFFFPSSKRLGVVCYYYDFFEGQVDGQFSS